MVGATLAVALEALSERAKPRPVLCLVLSGHVLEIWHAGGSSSPGGKPSTGVRFPAVIQPSPRYATIRKPPGTVVKAITRMQYSPALLAALWEPRAVLLPGEM